MLDVKNKYDIKKFKRILIDNSMFPLLRNMIIHIQIATFIFLYSKNIWQNRLIVAFSISNR